MRVCEILWDVTTADRVQRLIETTTGEPCPSMRGLPCPVVGNAKLPVPQEDPSD